MIPREPEFFYERNGRREEYLYAFVKSFSQFSFIVEQKDGDFVSFPVESVCDIDCLPLSSACAQVRGEKKNLFRAGRWFSYSYLSASMGLSFARFLGRVYSEDDSHQRGEYEGHEYGQHGYLGRPAGKGRGDF